MPLDQAIFCFLAVISTAWAFSLFLSMIFSIIHLDDDDKND